MKKWILWWAFWLNGVVISEAQVQLPALLQAQLQLNEAYQKQRVDLASWAREKNLPMRWKDSEGREIELAGIDETGMPVYYITDNVVAAHSTSTSRVWPGGVLGDTLAGQGMTIGEWDGGATRVTHQELTGRTIQADGATTLSNHATHVAGTMIASGVQPNARGMAWQANLLAYDWNNDNAEMAAAGQNGLLVSNHSYGQIAGWHSSSGQWFWYGNPALSDSFDWNFGFYNSKAQQWDQIAVNNPFYLIVKSAGNNRNQGPTPGTTHQVRNSSGAWVTSTTPRPRSGPYDCLPTYSVAKNILTIGAVNDLPNGWQSAAGVGMSSFSSWGPTDDGRIKPDIVGNGVGLYSSYSGSNTAYASISGTSMSGPNVAGSLILLQQRYKELHNVFMRSHTLKALALQTADEAGPDPGPDYMFGWGLLNTAKAVQLLGNADGASLIEEHLLENEGIVNINAFHPGGGPLKVTIAWTDPAGTPPPTSLNPTTAMLVNDLDLRLIHVASNTVHQPWILNPAVPAAAATTGDNFRDNVEQVFVANAPAGDYVVRISHKGNLRLQQPQAFGLAATGLVKGIQANFRADRQLLCNPDTIQFTSTSAGTSSFLWQFPGGIPATDTSANPRVFYANNGLYAVNLTVSGPQGTDSIRRQGFIRVGQGLDLPFFEDFESGDILERGWAINNPDTSFTWERFTVGGSSPGNQAMRMNFFAYNAPGQRDRLILPPLNLSGLDSAWMRFDHAYRAYNNSNADSLLVRVSTNCGQSWTTILAAGRTQLATATNSTTAFVPTLSSQWCGSGSNLSCFNLNLTPFTGNSLVYVQFEAWNGYGNNLYIDNVEINGRPNVVPQADFSSNSSRICAGDSVQFNDLSRGLPTARQWLFPGGSPAGSTDPDPQVTYANPGTYDVTLIVSNQVGNDTLTLTSAVRVDTIPQVSLAPLANRCTSEGLIILSGGTPAGGYYTGPGVVGGTQFDPAVAGPGLHNITYVYEQNGCSNAATQSLQVTATPQAAMALLLPRCVASMPITLTQGTPGGGTYSGPGVIGNQFDAALAGIGIHTITYTVNDNGCTASASGTITVTAEPQASITPLPDLCTNSSTQLLVGQPAAGNFSGPGVNLGVFNPAWAGAGLHTIEYVAVLNGCSSTAQIQVRVTTTPATPEISVDGGVLQSSATDSNQWYLNGQPMAGVNGQQFSPQQAGSYQVRVVNGSCLSNLSAPFVVSNVNVGEPSQASLRLYPNPSTGMVQLQWDAATLKATEVHIQSALGQLIYRTSASADGRQELILEHLPNGVYIVALLTQSGSYTSRLVIGK